MDDYLLDKVENKLRSKLKPYQPDPKFVDHLRERIIKPASMEVEYPVQRTSLLLSIAAGFAIVTIGLFVIRKISSR